VTIWKTRTSIETSLSSSSLEYEGPDWILDGDFYSGGSSLENPKVCLITAHNALLILDFKQDSCQDGHGVIEWHELGTGLGSILYSADVAWISPQQILVAAGTVFGEIIVWSYHLDSGSARLSAKNSLVIHYYFTGHEGSIFGVNISPEISLLNDAKPYRLLASCSDDRTIRVWDISDCSRSLNKSSVRYTTNGYGLHATGFGEKLSDDSDMNSTACIAKAWGHLSRIWGVYFLEPSLKHDCTSLGLVSRGEDATCLLWSMEFPPNDAPMRQIKLKNISSRNYHSGKNMWSLALHRDMDHYKIYTGGADGNLLSFEISDDVTRDFTYRTLKDRRDMTSICSDDAGPDGTVKISPISNKTKKKTKKDMGALKGYGFISRDCFLTASGQGTAWLGYVNSTTGNGKSVEAEGMTGSMPFVSFERIPTRDPIVGCPIIATLPKKCIAIVCDSKRGLHWYDKEKKALYLAEIMRGDISSLHLVDPDPIRPSGPSSDFSGSFAALVSYFNIPEADLVLNQTPDAESPVMHQIRLVLPEDFKVTGFLYIEKRGLAILGSRSGALAVYRLNNASLDDPPTISVYRRVHGEESVTSIIQVPQSNGEDTNQEIILSCGRDGKYSLHVLDFARDINRLRTVHQSGPPFGPNIEHAHFDESTNDLILYGFRHQSLVVWNESSQTEITSVECGGSHRAWTYIPRQNARGAGTYIWTQASTFNMFSIESPSHRVIRSGNHGREIKTFSISNPIAGFQGRKRRLLATGAEDTTIRIFDVDSSRANAQSSSFQCLRTLNKHKGGIQHLQWSPNGDFLFSSSGCEEFYVWSVQPVPGFGIGLVFESSCPKSKEVSDLRTISFDLLEVDGPEGKNCFLLCLAYSNSTVKVCTNIYKENQDPIG
jgi:WD40 repeat protein